MLPMLPPKIKSSTLPSEYRVLKTSLQRAEERTTVILQSLESSLADSDHMITLDARWLHFADSHEENDGPDPFEAVVYKANKMLDFLNQKQREQEACEDMMQQLFDTFHDIEPDRNVKEFGQVVRPATIADATGDWGGFQTEPDIQVRRTLHNCFDRRRNVGIDSTLAISIFVHVCGQQ
jgi:hypothetical protein